MKQQQKSLGQDWGGNLLKAGLLMTVPTTLGVAGGWITYSALGIDHQLPLPPALESQRATCDDAQCGRIHYYFDTQAGGRPLLLVHSVNAGASAYEMRPLFDHFRRQRAVYAPELPGFGFSDREPREYTSDLYTWAMLSFVRHVVKEPVDVVALSLSSEFLARAALAAPELFNSLTFISPTGFSAASETRSSQRASARGDSDYVFNLLSFPLWSQALFDLIATRRSIRYFLQRSFNGPLDEGLADYAYRCAHQPGARHAPLRFVSGRLFTRNVRHSLYRFIRRPVLVLYDQDGYTRFTRLDEFVAEHDNWQATRLSGTRGLPHFEALDQVVLALESYWSAEEA